MKIYLVHCKVDYCESVGFLREEDQEEYFIEKYKYYGPHVSRFIGLKKETIEVAE